MVREGVTTTVQFSGVNGLVEGSKTQFTLELVRPSLCESSSYYQYIDTSISMMGDFIAAPSDSSHSISTSTTASYQSATSVTEPISTLSRINRFQENMYEIVSSVDARRLALALVSESSQEKCPNLDKSARDKIESFLETARSSSDNFSANYDIVADLFIIAKRFPSYMSAVQAALGKCLDYLVSIVNYSEFRPNGILFSKSFAV